MSVVTSISTLLDIVRRESAISGRSVFSILTGALRAKVSYGLGYKYFIMTGLAREDFNPNEVAKHLSSKDYTRAIEILNPLAYRKITQHKFVEKALYNALHINSAELLGYYHFQRGVTAQGDPLNDIVQLSDYLTKFVGQKICFKLCEGWSGKGFYAGTIEMQNGELSVRKLFSDERIKLRDLIETFVNDDNEVELIFERYVTQAAGIAQFNDTSVNTIRAWVLDDGSKIELIGAVIRIGRKGSLTDNSGAGGITVGIDIKTGTLRQGLLPADPVRPNLTQHPDTKAQLTGVVIPQWKEIVDFSCEVLKRLPQTHFVGLDISLTEDGPLLIETNPLPDKDSAAKGPIPAIKLKQAAQKWLSK